MKILIPIRYPLTDDNKQAIRRGIELIEGHENPELPIFHMNEIQNDQRISRQTMHEAVESVFEGLETSYVVRDEFLVEEAIIEEAIRLQMDYIILGKHRRDRWKKLLEEILNLPQNPEQIIRDKTGIELEVVGDAESNSTTI